jgi:hypothetical protein
MIYRRYLEETRIYLGIDKFETPNLGDPENSQNILEKLFLIGKYPLKTNSKSLTSIETITDPNSTVNRLKPLEL